MQGSHHSLRYQARKHSPGQRLQPKGGRFWVSEAGWKRFQPRIDHHKRMCIDLAPEWISGLPITSKVDVYSFGMTLLEIISGRRNLDLKVEESRLYFPTWASSQIQRGNIRDVVDARIASEANIEEVRRAAVVAGLCIQDDENRRPSMGEVVKILEGTLEAPVPQIPRSLQLLLGQVDDDESTTSHGEPPSVSGCSVLEK